MNCQFYFEGEDKISVDKRKSHYSLFVLADGHGNSDYVSSYIKNNYDKIFNKLYNENYLKYKSNENILYTTIIKESIKQLDNTFLTCKDGSTIVGFILPSNSDNCYIFNVGDSRCYGLSRQSKQIIQFSEDHNLFNPAEIKRLNIKIDINDSSRRLEKVLAMTRSIGDMDVKSKISTPFITVIKNIKKDYSHVIILSDGLYGSIDNTTLSFYLTSKQTLKIALAGILNFVRANGIDDDKSILIKPM